MKILFNFLEFVTKLQYAVQPSFIQDENRLQKMLLWSARSYYIYSTLIFALTKGLDYFNIDIDPYFFVIAALFSIQAAILLYTIQVYRRISSLSSKFKSNFALRAFFLLWLMLFFLLSVERIIGYPFFSGSILILVARGKGAFFGEMLNNGFFWGIFFTALATAGEYLMKKINLA